MITFTMAADDAKALKVLLDGQNLASYPPAIERAMLALAAGVNEALQKPEKKKATITVKKKRVIVPE